MLIHNWTLVGLTIQSAVSLSSAFLGSAYYNCNNFLHHAYPSQKVFGAAHLYNSWPKLQLLTNIEIHALAATESSDDITAEEEEDDDEVVIGCTLKMAFDASSVWGVADLSETKSERFTSPESLDMVHRLRRESDAVLVGRGTVDRDDCSLTVRRVELGDGKNQPVRVVIDPSLRITGGDYTLLKDGIPTIIYHLQPEMSKAVPSDYVTYVGLKQSTYSDGSRSSMSPKQVIKDLRRRGLEHVMVEGGPTTARSFLEARLVDRAILVRAPIEFEIPIPAEMDENTLKRAGLQMIGTAIMGGDTIEYWTRDGMPWPNADLSMWP